MFKAGAGGSTKAVGDDAEALALAWLQARGLVLVQRNYRVARGPRRTRRRDRPHPARARRHAGLRRGARAPQRAHGGAAASVGAAKRRALVFAAQHFLSRLPTLPPCRFDVIAIDGDRIEWLRGAFDAG